MFSDKTILVAGGTGSWGKELIKQLLENYSPREIRVYSRNEYNQVLMKRSFSNQKLKFMIGDVRDDQRLSEAMKNVDIAFNLAALKHVPVCEESPEEAVKTNIDGARNLVRACINNDVKKCVFVSTDKAVEPFNLYGATKAVAEKLIIAANLHQKTKFVCVRGGNVIGTNGSVVPLFKRQLKETNSITITDGSMTRYWLKLEEAISLVFKAAERSVGGEIFVMKMPGSTISLLVDVMITSLGDENTQIKTIGIRPGEKKHEVLVSKHESSRVVEEGNFYIILPMINIPDTDSHYKEYNLKEMDEFTSLNTKQLSNEELTSLLGEWLNKNPSSDMFQNLSKADIEKWMKEGKWL